MIRTIHEFTGGYTRFFIRRSYGASLLKALRFCLSVFLLFMFFELISLVLLRIFSLDDFFSGLYIIISDFILLSFALMGIMLVFFVFGTHMMIKIFRKRSSLGDTFMVFSYSLTPIFLIIPFVILYGMMNSYLLDSPDSVFYSHTLLIIWMFLMFSFLSLRMFVKGLSIVHRIPQKKLFVLAIVSLSLFVLSLYLIPLDFSQLAFWLAV
jgi:hypothetical protein